MRKYSVHGRAGGKMGDQTNNAGWAQKNSSVYFIQWKLVIRKSAAEGRRDYKSSDGSSC